VFVQLLSSPIL